VCPSPPDPSAERPDDDTAIGIETFVREVSGQWLVDIAVAFPDGVVRHSVNTYRTERHARIAAQWIRRAASRDIEGPTNG
jgi:hypothetical protein